MPGIHILTLALAILWLVLVADAVAIFRAGWALRRVEAEQLRRANYRIRNDIKPVSVKQRFYAVAIMLFLLCLVTVFNYYSSTWSIRAIETVIHNDARVRAAFLELFFLPLTSGAAEFRLLYRLARDGSMTHLIDELMQVLKLRLVYSFLFAQMVSLHFGQGYAPTFTNTSAALFFAIMVIAIMLIWKRIAPSALLALLFFVLFLLVLIDTWTNGEAAHSDPQENITTLFTPQQRR